MEADISSQAVGLASSADFSILNLFIRADIIVKSVIIILIAASIYSWAIIIEKYRLFKKINKSSEEFENKFWKSRSAESFYNSLPQNIDDPMANVFKDTMQVIVKAKSKSNISNRLESMLEVSIEKQMNTIEKSYTFLATVGSTAPFIGLFGTVWGIMNSFQSIAISRNTSLAIVAPGIAEALFATALGLLAAIPAVVAYNKLSADLDRYAGRLEGFSSEFSAILSRQLDRRVKKAGEFAMSTGEETHIEGGGEIGCTIYQNVRANSDLVYSVLNDDLSLKLDVSIQHFYQDFLKDAA